jgi:hypothetical protein
LQSVQSAQPAQPLLNVNRPVVIWLKVVLLITLLLELAQ